MSKLNPRVDFAFKIIFGSEENKDLLHAILNAVLPAEDQVESLTLLNPYTRQSHLTEKLSILDIRAVDKNGHHLCIEMQVTDQLEYEKRALFLWSKVYAEQLKSGASYSTLKKTIGIHILNFNMMDEPDFHNIYGVYNQKSNKRHFNDFQLHVIELEKFGKNYEDLKTGLDRWITFLTRAHEIDSKKLPKTLASDQDIQKAMTVLETMYLTDEERRIYEAQQTWMRDEAAAIEKAEFLAKEEGRVEGKAEGKAEGRAEGIAEGIAQKNRQTVIALHHEKMDIPLIQKITGLSVVEIEKILAQP